MTKIFFHCTLSSDDFYFKNAKGETIMVSTKEFPVSENQYLVPLYPIFKQIYTLWHFRKYFFKRELHILIKPFLMGALTID